MATPEEKRINTSPMEDPQQLLQVELEEVNRSHKEITLMLEQSRVEVAKLTQRNAAVTTQLQQVRSQAEMVPAHEITQAYDTALDAQQRLFVMRGQLEKLQNDEMHMERLRKTLEQIQTAYTNKTGSGKGEKTLMTSVEMLVDAQEAERQRLSRQMHDGPAQALSNFILQTEIAIKFLDMDPKQARSELDSLKVAAMSTFKKVRNFIFELRPMMLDDLGLVPTIRRYAETFKEQAGIEIGVNVTGVERRLESYIEVMIFRALQELLSNALHQGQANLVKVHIDFGDSMVKLSVDNNGKGTDTDVLNKEGNIGLKLIKERAEMMGGSLSIDSAPAMGSRFTLAIPAQK